MVGRKVNESPFTLGGRVGKLMYRDSQYASKNFRIDGNSFATSLLPKPKFLFFVQFVRAADSAVFDSVGQSSGVSRLSNTKDGIIFQIKQIDRPKFNIKTETLVQYNKKRVIQTGIEYQNMTISFHDDVSDQVMEFWTEYYSFYYGDGRKIRSSEWRSDIVTNEFDEGLGGTGWGYLGRFNGPGGAEAMHFLEEINIFQFYAGQYTTMTFVHPKLTIFDHDQNDYEDGREGTGIRMSFDYEGVIYDLTPRRVNGPVPEGQISATAEQFGFSNEYFDTGEISRSLPTQFKFIHPSTSDIASRANLAPTGSELIADAVAEATQRRIRAGTSVLSPTGFTFGRGPTGLTSQVINLVTATSLSGETPSADLIQKATGVKNTIDNFGVFQNQSAISAITNIPTAINSGIDSTKVAQAGSILSEVISNTEQVVGPGQTTFADPSAISRFKNSFGTAAALAQRQGLVDSTATFVNKIDSTSADNRTMVNKLPDGSFQATETGLFVFQSMRAPTSALGTKRPKNPFINPNTVDTNDRALLAETREI